MCINRYITKGIKAEIPQFMQDVLWYMFEVMEISKKDELQIFQLSPVSEAESIKQSIEHSQECPTYEMKNIITVEKPLEAKIYVINYGSCCFMMLANEY